MREAVLCVDFGSTFTKAGLVDVETGELLGTAGQRTTVGTDLMEAFDDLRSRLDAERAEVRACSSAGGGLRIAVVGHEALVTGEAGRRVALSSGGLVVHVEAGALADTAGLAAACPDVILLVGGIDGGNTRVVRENAAALAKARLGVPVVVACNRTARAEVVARLEEAETPGVATENVLPELGVVRPEPARAAIRDAFVRHVIGGKGLSRRAEFGEIVHGATPDLVLRGVESLARLRSCEVTVVDVGGATTDVHSVVTPANESTDVVATLPVSRTVEGDLGLRWTAPGVLEAAVDARLLSIDEGDALRVEAERRVADPGLVAADAEQLEVDERLVTLAMTIALRRHAGRDRVRFGPDGRVVERSGKDLRRVRLLVGSGGLLRHVPNQVATSALTAALADDDNEGWLVPTRPGIAVDSAYVLAAAGLLADDHPEAVAGLLSRHIRDQ